uniref:Uncharacterized protein n=1 Tax=Vespula pensylvanica TaxID=30213 RepID=A0A834P7H0_VESPE|nr:hypothetical protein H0235_004594 [Vespula pensylvanica]
MKVSWSPPVQLIKPSRTKCDRGGGGGLEPSDSKLLPTLYALRADIFEKVSSQKLRIVRKEAEIHSRRNDEATFPV